MRDMKLSSKLEQICASAKVSQAELARITSANKDTVGAWFSGKSMPNVHQAFLIAQHLKVPLEYLADDRFSSPDELPATGPPLSDEDRQILDLVRKMGHQAAFNRLVLLATDDRMITGGGADEREARLREERRGKERFR